MHEDKILEAMVRGGMTPSIAFDLLRKTIGDGPATSALARYEQKVGLHRTGHRLYIVLSGSHDTQQRLRDQLLGPDNRHWVILPSAEDDLRPSGNNINAFLADGSHLKIVCVVAKAAHELQRLLSWLESGEPAVLAGCPALIVDEAGDDEPNDVGDLLGQISGLLPKATYVRERFRGSVYL